MRYWVSFRPENSLEIEWKFVEDVKCGLEGSGRDLVDTMRDLVRMWGEGDDKGIGEIMGEIQKLIEVGK